MLEHRGVFHALDHANGLSLYESFIDQFGKFSEEEYLFVGLSPKELGAPQQPHGRA